MHGIILTIVIAAQMHGAADAFQPQSLSPLMLGGHQRWLHPHPPCFPRAEVQHRHTKLPTTALRVLFGDENEQGDEVTIPAELSDEIYRAEANTPAAQGRQVRIALYVLSAIVGASIAFFNAFLTEMRFGEGAPSEDLAFYGFGWVQENSLSSFFFTNAIGGGVGLLGAGLSGTLAEVEIRSKKENAEKIWAEMQRRKALKEKPSKSTKKKNKRSSSKKDMTGKQKKRLSALEELMVEEEVAVSNDEVAEAGTTKGDSVVEEEESNILGKIQGFYKKADAMAASQALLLNKELEDMGVVEKITDESGLKVIGKEAAAAAKKEKEAAAAAKNEKDALK